MHEQLISFFKSNTSFDDINWIAANVGDRAKENPFIRTLATACCINSIVNLKLKADILQGKYNLDNKPIYELQCLYALQALINKFNILKAFYLLYVIKFTKKMCFHMKV